MTTPRSPRTRPATIREQVRLAPFTTWQVGGEARYFLEPTSVDEAVEAASWAREAGLAVATIGRGSNLLVADEGFEGLVLRFGNQFNQARFEGDRLICQAGLTCAQMVMLGVAKGLGGNEAMVGVPGTVGGAVAMNASCHGAAISEGFLQGRVLLQDGTVAAWDHADFRFTYRHSRLHEEPVVFLEGTWQLRPVDPAEAKAKVIEFQQWRHRMQPTNVPTGGSTFRNPGEPHPAAGALIELVGAKGLRIGGAEVSEKHANFIVNRGGATASEINALVSEIQKRVFESHGVMLRPEVVGLGLTVGLPC